LSNATSAIVVGGGSWGTALANLLSSKGIQTVIWARERNVVDSINSRRENTTFLPGITLSESLRATADLSAGLRSANVVINAVPTQFIANTYRPIGDLVAATEILVSVSKGIEVGTLLLPHDIVVDLLGSASNTSIVALSGPSFAREVGANHPTAVVAASRDLDAAHLVQRLFSTDTFRVYASDDIVGVELGGAVKNVIAIAAGIVEGLRYGHNTLAALITRGVAEMTRLGTAMGGNPLTFSGLSGMGDLVLTCTGGLSRNRTVGVELGRGRQIDDILDDMEMVAEGVKTTEALHSLAIKLDVDMPITDQVYQVLYEGKDVRLVPRDLMIRQLKDEIEHPPPSI
jgi:glycerol-3-phosphate dehydrogenase (NAD(P)+)